MAEELRWAQLFQRRCRAVREARPGQGLWGRCELLADHEGDHALERGMDCPRWSTNWTA